MAKYFTLDGQVIAEAEELPQQFIQVSNGTALMWDFTGVEATSSLVSSELLSIILGVPVAASVSDLVTCETCGYGPCHCGQLKKGLPMNTQSFLRQFQTDTFRMGDELADEALAPAGWSDERHKQANRGVAIMRYANSVWPLIHLHSAFDRSYYALLRLAK